VVIAFNLESEVTITEAQKLLNRCRTGVGRKALTIFFGRADAAVAAELDRACREQQALLLYWHDGAARFSLPEDSPLFHVAASGLTDALAVLELLCDHFILEEGFQLNTSCGPGGEALLERSRGAILDLLSALKFRRRAGLMLWRCLLRNLPLIRRQRRPALPQPADSVAALICAAGPSLNSQLELIRQHRDRFHLFCVGRAYARLRSAGIVPDLVVEIDAEGYGFNSGGEPPVCPLAASATAAPAVTSQFADVFWLADPDPVRGAYLTAQVGALPSAVLSRSVVVTALDLAVRAGYRRIALVGSDLCLADDGTLYGRSRGEDYGAGSSLISLPGNDCPEVVSLPNLVGIRASLQDYLAACPARITNCTAGGAKIEHARRETLTSWLSGLTASPGPLVVPAAAPVNAFSTEPPAVAVDAFLSVVEREAQPDGPVFDLAGALRRDLADPAADVYRYSAFRDYALAWVSRRNPDYAAWLAALPDTEAEPDGFAVKSFLQLLPEVRHGQGGAVLTPGDNREQFACDVIRRLASDVQLDPRRDAVVVVGPGDWQEVVELVRHYPALSLLVIDPHPRLFRRIIEYSMFFHLFPADAYVTGVTDGAFDWRRGALAIVREWKRAGRRIHQFTHPALAAAPDAACQALLAEVSARLL